jgi:hypothetical protein
MEAVEDILAFIALFCLFTLLFIGTRGSGGHILIHGI